jgi:hypothetical protein
VSVAGELGDFDLVGILQLLGGNRASGRLRVTAGGDDVALYLDVGRVVAVTSSRLPLRLGRMLSQRGLVTERQLSDALRQQARDDTRRPLGEILVDRGWVTEADISACVHDQCVAVLARILAAGEGTFAYESGAQQPARGPSLPLEAHAALLEALRRVDELGRLRALLPPPDAPLAINHMTDTIFVPTGDVETQILGALRTGVWSWRDLVDLLQFDEPTLLRTLIALRERGVVVTRSGGNGAHQTESPDEEANRRLETGVLDAQRTKAAATDPVLTNAMEEMFVWGSGPPPNRSE